MKHDAIKGDKVSVVFGSGENNYINGTLIDFNNGYQSVQIMSEDNSMHWIPNVLVLSKRSESNERSKK